MCLTRQTKINKYHHPIFLSNSVKQPCVKFYNLNYSDQKMCVYLTWTKLSAVNFTKYWQHNNFVKNVCIYEVCKEHWGVQFRDVNHWDRTNQRELWHRLRLYFLIVFDSCVFLVDRYMFCIHYKLKVKTLSLLGLWYKLTVIHINI